jgi:hypothetical protein
MPWRGLLKLRGCQLGRRKLVYDINSIAEKTLTEILAAYPGQLQTKKVVMQVLNMVRSVTKIKVEISYASNISVPQFRLLELRTKT